MGISFIIWNVMDIIYKSTHIGDTNTYWRYPVVSSNVAVWKIPNQKWRFIARTIIDLTDVLFIATFENQRVNDA